MVRLLRDLLAGWFPVPQKSVRRAPKYESFVCPACHFAAMYNRYVVSRTLAAEAHADECLGWCPAPNFGRYCPLCNYAGRG